MAQQNNEIFQENSFNEDEPPHPKTFTHIPIRSNNSKTIQLNMKNIQKLQIKTARESFRKRQEKSSQRNLYSSKNSRAIMIEAPSNNNSPKTNEEQLFVPERKKINESNKFFTQNKNFKSKSTSYYKPQQLGQSNISIKIPQKKLINNSLTSNTAKQLSFTQNRNTIHHIVKLRKYQNTQKQRQTQLNNRLRFFTVQKERDTKRLQFAKRKYEKVVAVRSQFIKEKQSIQKKKIFNYLEEMNEKHKKISKIKEQQQQKKLSVSRLSQTKSLEASRLRSEQKSITHQIRTKEIFQLQRKKEQIKASQLRSQKAHQKLIQVNRSRIETIRSIENKQIVKNLLNVSQKQKMNQKLQERLQKEIALINQNKQKSANQLQKYEEFLGLKNKKKNQMESILKNKNENPYALNHPKSSKRPKIDSSTYSTLRSKSFYLTNY